MELKSRFTEITATLEVHSDGSVTAREYTWRGELSKEVGFSSVKAARVIYCDAHWKPLYEKVGGVAVVHEAQVKRGQPTDTIGKSAAEICEMIMHDPTMVTDKATGKTTSVLYDYVQEISTAIFDRDYWKAPVVVVAPKIDIQWVIATIRWFHGDDPDVTTWDDGQVAIVGHGYSC